MLRYIAGRAFSSALTVLGAIVLLFLLSLLIPGDLARTVLGPQAPLEAVEWYRQQLGLNLPIHERLVRYLAQVAAGDFGIDVITGRPIRAIVLDVLPNTVSLAFGAIGLAVAIGIPLGAYSATHPGRLADQVLAILSVGMIAVPSFVVAVLLVLIFAIWLPVLPVLGITTDRTVGATLARLVLPCFALAISWIGYIARLVRSSLLEVLGEPYVRTYRAFGVSEARIVLVLALRNACLPTVSVLGLGIGSLLGGALVVEIVFTRPGLGTVMYAAISDRNFPIVQGATLVAVLLFTVTNLLADLSYALLDPRIRERMQDTGATQVPA